MYSVNKKIIKQGHYGFTIIELLIAMAISGIVMAAVYTVYQKQQEYYTAQSQVTEMQQNLRSGSNFLTSDLRMVGYDPLGTGKFKLLDIGRDVDGNSTIKFAVDFDEDGHWDNANSSKVITYSLYDYTGDNDDIQDLAREVGIGTGAGGRQLVAESIEALGIAYAYDAVPTDGVLDESGGNIIWAIDTGTDNILDSNLNGVGISPVPLSQIRAAKIWILAKSKIPDPNFHNNTTYVVADRNIVTGDNHRRRLLEFSIYFRNTGI